MKIAKGLSTKCVSKKHMGLTLIKVEPFFITRSSYLGEKPPSANKHETRQSYPK
jgi:hypothetical protein